MQQKQKLLQDNAKKYHEFLQENFHRAFGFIQRKVVCGKSEQFLEQSISLSFSRFPQFQQFFAQQILKNNSEVVNEWDEIGNKPLEQGIRIEEVSAEKFEWN